jgi:quinol monooxygenase YgiN
MTRPALALLTNITEEIDMTIGLIGTIRVRPEKVAEFEALMLNAVDRVRANEPGVISYHFTKSRDEPNTYKMLEVYADQAAITAHGESEDLRAGWPNFLTLIASPVEVEYLDGISRES